MTERNGWLILFFTTRSLRLLEAGRTGEDSMLDEGCWILDAWYWRSPLVSLRGSFLTGYRGGRDYFFEYEYEYEYEYEDEGAGVRPPNSLLR
jgi:hypothetical protein